MENSEENSTIEPILENLEQIFKELLSTLVDANLLIC